MLRPGVDAVDIPCDDFHGESSIFLWLLVGGVPYTKTMTRTATLLIFATLSLILFWGHAADARNGWPSCPENGRHVALYFESSKGNLRYHDGFSSQQIASLSGTAGHRLGPLWTPTGLTLADNRYELKTSTKIYDLGHGRYCAVLTQAQLFLGFREIDVYVSNKYRRGSCEYESILNHENRHVQIFRDTLYRHSLGIEKAFRNEAPRIGPVYLRSANAAADRIQRLLDAKLRPLFTRMEQDLNRRNAKIDTRENYRYEQSLCADW